MMSEELLETYQRVTQEIYGIGDGWTYVTELSGDSAADLLEQEKPSFEEWKAITGDTRAEYEKTDFDVQDEFDSATLWIGVEMRRNSKGQRISPEIHYCLDAEKKDSSYQIKTGVVDPEDDFFQRLNEVL